MKIVIIGPIYPFKGGIAHYTSLLSKELEKTNEVIVVSFKLLYPRFLYPGDNQKDYQNDKFKFPNTKYLINSINPFNWINVVRQIRKLNPELIIFQWWNPFFSFAFTFIALFSKAKVLFTCHNVIPHEKIPFQNFLTKLTLKTGKYYIVHSKVDEDNLKTMLPNAKYKRTFHPSYNSFNNNLSKTEARKELNLLDSDKILLFFGFVREYKGLKYLLEALPKVLEKYKEIKLLVVGDFYQDKDKYINIIESLNISDHVLIFDDYIPDNEVGKYFASCDLVVLPYISATQSGIVQIAYGFNKPVIATIVGGLPEVVIDNYTGYLCEVQNANHLAEKIVEFFALNKQPIFEENIIKENPKYSWEYMAQAISELIDKEGKTDEINHSNTMF